MFDLAQATDVSMRIQASATWRPARLEEPDSLVLAQCRRMQLNQPCGDTDDVECFGGRQPRRGRTRRKLMRVTIHFVRSTSYTLDDARAIRRLHASPDEPVRAAT